jgi:hypothetical protein
MGFVQLLTEGCMKFGLLTPQWNMDKHWVIHKKQPKYDKTYAF